MQIGLFFGSFNPIHTGHLLIANHILNTTIFENIWFVVSPQNPFKEPGSLLDEKARFHMVSLAVKEDKRLTASDVEFSLTKPSYTINTLSFLQKTYSNGFSIIMGTDSLNTFEKWKDYSAIVEQYKILVYRRPGFEIPGSTHPNIQILDAPLLDISSTAIRSLINKGKSIRYLVPDIVRTEIEKNSYYR